MQNLDTENNYQIKELEKDIEYYKSRIEELETENKRVKEIIKMLHSDCYSIAECEDTNLGLWEDDLAMAKNFLNK